MLLREQLAELARGALALTQTLRELTPRGALRRQLPLVARALALRRQHGRVSLPPSRWLRRQDKLPVGGPCAAKGKVCECTSYTPRTDPALQCRLAHTVLESSAQTDPQHTLACHPPPLKQQLSDISTCVPVHTVG